MIDIDYIYSHIPQEIQEDLPLEYPLPLQVEATQGSFLLDDKGNRYLDLTSNQDMQPFGYSFEKFENKSFYVDTNLFKSSKDQNLKKK